MTAQSSVPASVSEASSLSASNLADSQDSRLKSLAAWLSGLAESFSLDMAQWAPASADASFRRYFRA
jgi:hypothetical protein